MLMRNDYFALIVVLFGYACLAQADFEDLSNSQLENLLRDIEYAEDYKNNYDYDPLLNVNNGNAPRMHDYYDDYKVDSAEATYPFGNDYEQQFIPMPEQHSESLSHGSPMGVSSGTTKANPKNPGAVLPAYCDPPNPCPLGYTAKDGCLEEFENTSDFSRQYQAKQKCLCDSEHMFNCPANTRQDQQEEARKLGSPFLASLPETDLEGDNPFLAGHKLPIAAKKGLGF